MTDKPWYLRGLPFALIHCAYMGTRTTTVQREMERLELGAAMNWDPILQHYSYDFGCWIKPNGKRWGR